MRLRTKTSLLMAVIAAICVGTISLFFIRFLESSLRKTIYSNIETISGSTAESVTMLLNDSLNDAKAIAFNLPADVIEKRKPDEAEKFMKSMVELYPRFENGMFLLDKNGKLWSDYPYYSETRGKSFAFREYFKRTMEEGKGIIGTPYISARTGQPVITVTALIRDRNNKVAGLLGCSMRLLSPQLFGGIRQEKIGESGYIYIADKSRMIILHPDDKRILKKDIPAGANKLLDAGIDGFEGVGETVNSRGIPMLLSLRQIPNTNWVLGAQQPKYEAFAPMREALKRSVFSVLCVAMLAGLIGIIAIRRITYPVLKLREVTLKLGETPLDDKLEELKSDDEIGDLYRTYHEISLNLNKTVSILRTARREWELTFDSVPDAIFITDKEGKIGRLNFAASKLFKMKFTEMIGRPCYEVIHRNDIPLCPHKEFLDRGKTTREEIEAPDGNSFFEIITTPLTDETGNIVGSVHIVVDITVRKTAEMALKESEQKYREIVENSMDMIFTCDLEGNCTSCNRAIEEITGYTRDEIIGANYKTFFDKENTRKITEIRNKLYELGIQLKESTFEIITKDKRKLTIKVNASHIIKDGKKTGFLGIMRDVTEQQKLESHMIRTEKLEAIGTLAGGIAHDFNNILTAIMGYLNLAKLFPEDPETIQNYISKAETAVLGATGLTRQLLTFSRGGEPFRETIYIQPVIDEAASMALGKSSSSTCEMHYGENIKPVDADRGQILQVMTNLLINARQAMPGGGTIVVAVKNVFVDGRNGRGSLPEGEYVSVSVGDEGVGIPQNNLQKIFDPFYTTKKEGSGLGLATSHSIIARHGGYIEVESLVGEGSVFTFYLPAAKGALRKSEVKKEKIIIGTGRILLMDDEADIRDLGLTILKKAGYEVDAVEDGEKAIDLYVEARAAGRPYKAVIFDLTIPGGFGGMDAMKVLKEMDPGIKGIVISGYSQDPVMSNPEKYGFSAALQKPFNITSLTHVLNSITVNDGGMLNREG
ncbi:MAG: PAS domain S-box protein [Desulfobacteraceae bacterium]|nr:MAG: PAS domain S-box protein [Desulfobacteraceae bacterium]